MKIDFNEIPQKDEKNFKGGEKSALLSIFSGEGAKIIRGVLVPGASIGYHKHETDSEIIYVISGEANVLYEGNEITVEAGCAHYCPNGYSHSLRNHGSEDLVFFAVIK